MNWETINSTDEYLHAKDRLKEISESKPGDESYDEAVKLTHLLEKYEAEQKRISSSHGLIQAIQSAIEEHSQLDNELNKEMSQKGNKKPVKIIGARDDDSSFLGIIG